MIELDKYTLDTLQIYFPWDDDLYTYFKNKGLGTKNTKKKALPLIYTDNCISTTGVEALKRRFVLHPKYFGRTIEELGWTRTKRDDEPIIPAEKPQVKVSLLDEHTSESKIKFKIIPTVDDKEQYHIEYSAMSAFGKMYTNWSIIYLTINDFRDLVSKINQTIKHKPKTFTDFPLLTETQQAQREELHYVEVPVVTYKFCLGEFKYALEYLRHNGVDGKIQSLVYESSNPQHRNLMEPVIKFGIVHTLTDQGFMARKPQIVMKIAQPKVTMGKRGKRVKKKGSIVEDTECENYFAVYTKSFLDRTQKLRSWFNSQPEFKEFSL